jgi:hypothetical protein
MSDDNASADLRRLLELESSVDRAALRLELAKEAVKEARAGFESAKGEYRQFVAELRSDRPLFRREESP